MDWPSSSNPYGFRTPNPTVWLQYPYDVTSHTPERVLTVSAQSGLLLADCGQVARRQPAPGP